MLDLRDSPNRPAATPAPASASVLVVDDDLSNRESLSRRLLRRGYDVATAAGGQLNERLPWNDATRQFLTLCYGTLDTQTGRFAYTSAGHPPAVYVPVGKALRLLDGSGLPIGLAEEAYDRHELQLQPGDRVLMYSDGVTEAMNSSSDLFGNDRLLAALQRGAKVDLEQSVKLLMDEICAWRGNAASRDDASALAFEFTSLPLMA